MKKTVLILCLSILCIVLTGCAGSNITLTESESNAIAQYSAHLLLKHDKNGIYDNKLLDEKEFEQEEAARYEAEQELQVTPEPETPVVPTEEPEKPSVPEPTGSAESSDKAESSETQKVSETAVFIPAQTEDKSLSRYFDNTKFEITYDGYYLNREYKSETEYFSLTAPEGQKVLIISLKVKNITDSAVKFVSSDYDITYQVTTESKTYDPRISLLSNDARFMNETIGSGKSQAIVLLFFVDDNTKFINFKVSGNNSGSSKEKAYEINIK